jgi:hypothetical protein
MIASSSLAQVFGLGTSKKSRRASLVSSAEEAKIAQAIIQRYRGGFGGTTAPAGFSL